MSILQVMYLGFLAVGVVSSWIWFVRRPQDALRCARACASEQMAELDALQSLEQFVVLCASQQEAEPDALQSLEAFVDLFQSGDF